MIYAPLLLPHRTIPFNLKRGRREGGEGEVGGYWPKFKETMGPQELLKEDKETKGHQLGAF